uniref:NADH-ubiquinone oxidoreductase chain 2 n=1 Tax=Cheiracanthium brevispinum TaxID=2773961 RepID=A0AA51VJ10_9ARAC|nr:NADH dehydrogenase subunit 2 [Cheiracanthium brevispinum]WMX19906.1 NADH dehydrogenase subunit 2 [Cheiracanthium brevispinum]
MPSFFLFIVLYIISFFFVLGCNDWFLLWLSLEINMISFIMLIYKRYDLYNLESCYKYFFIQSMSSAFFLSLLFFNSFKMSFLVLMLLSLKIGAGPFFFWFPSVVKGINWISGFLLMTFQKIIPLLIMSMFIGSLLWLIGIMSLLIGVFGSFNQINIKELMAYSSVHHLGWIISCMMIDNMYWFMYLFVYGMMLAGVIYVLIDEEIINLIMINKIKGKWWFLLSMMSMGGMPPLLGFFLKMVTLYYIFMLDIFYVMFLLLMSVIMFYVYIRMLYDIMMGYKYEVMWSMNIMSKNYYKKDYFSFIGILLMMMLGLLMLF